MKGTAKKAAAGILAAVTVMALGTGALAAGTGRNFRGADGVCGLRSTACGGQECACTDADGDSICDLRSTAAGGRFYVDADGDGICGRAGTGYGCRMAGTRGGHGGCRR